jgi:biotin transport system substrate-specific component
MNIAYDLRMTVYASLMAALIAAGAFISIPIGPVPLVMQNFFVLLSGVLLGKKWGTAGVGVYLLAGILGLPVFAGGTGGIGRIVGPTGGYLLGYLPAVFVTGLISEAGAKIKWMELPAMAAGMVVVYAIGVPWLKMVTGLTLDKALALGLYPFLLGDALKIAAAMPVIKVIRPIIKKT